MFGGFFLETIKGFVKHIIFKNPQNGYIIFKLVSEETEITCKGTLVQLDEGEFIEAEGFGAKIFRRRTMRRMILPRQGGQFLSPTIPRTRRVRFFSCNKRASSRFPRAHPRPTRFRFSTSLRTMTMLSPKWQRRWCPHNSSVGTTERSRSSTAITHLKAGSPRTNLRMYSLMNPQQA